MLTFDNVLGIQFSLLPFILIFPKDCKMYNSFFGKGSKTQRNFSSVAVETVFLINCIWRNRKQNQVSCTFEDFCLLEVFGTLSLLPLEKTCLLWIDIYWHLNAWLFPLRLYAVPRKLMIVLLKPYGIRGRSSQNFTVWAVLPYGFFFFYNSHVYFQLLLMFLRNLMVPNYSYKTLKPVKQ